MELTSASAAPILAIQNLTFGEGVLYAILGMLVVFFALVLLMVIIKILVAATDKSAAKKEAKAAAEAPAPEAPAAEEPAPVKKDGPAPGTAGEIKLYTTDPKEAAMIMAIVADALGKPLNELRFKSIREIKG